MASYPSTNPEGNWLEQLQRQPSAVSFSSLVAAEWQPLAIKSSRIICVGSWSSVNDGVMNRGPFIFDHSATCCKR